MRRTLQERREGVDESPLEQRRVAEDLGDASPCVAPAPDDARERACAWCGSPFVPSRPWNVFCKKSCRQTAWRLAQHGVSRDANHRPIRVAYADPPYPGFAWTYYRKPEVDHGELVARLVREFPDGWALSTSAEALRCVLPLCPKGTRVCPWVKPHGANPSSLGLHNCWEPLLVYGGRQRAPGKRDTLTAMPARGGGDLPGRKPIAFAHFTFDCLGLEPGDDFVDLPPFEGTGIMGRAWRELCRRSNASDRPPATDRVGDVVRDASRGL